jgi:hypothetical protein
MVDYNDKYDKYDKFNIKEKKYNKKKIYTSKFVRISLQKVVNSNKKK